MTTHCARVCEGRLLVWAVLSGGCLLLFAVASWANGIHPVSSSVYLNSLDSIFRGARTMRFRSNYNVGVVLLNPPTEGQASAGIRSVARVCSQLSVPSRGSFSCIVHEESRVVGDDIQALAAYTMEMFTPGTPTPDLYIFVRASSNGVLGVEHLSEQKVVISVESWSSSSTSEVETLLNRLSQVMGSVDDGEAFKMTKLDSDPSVSVGLLCRGSHAFCERASLHYPRSIATIRGSASAMLPLLGSHELTVDILPPEYAAEPLEQAELNIGVIEGLKRHAERSFRASGTQLQLLMVFADSHGNHSAVARVARVAGYGIAVFVPLSESTDASALSGALLQIIPLVVANELLPDLGIHDQEQLNAKSISLLLKPLPRLHLLYACARVETVTTALRNFLLTNPNVEVNYDLLEQLNTAASIMTEAEMNGRVLGHITAVEEILKGVHFSPTMLPQVYHTLEHKIAVLFPTLAPIILSSGAALLKLWRRRNLQKLGE